MGKPHIHAKASVKHFGGKAKDYIEIHEFLDSSRTTFPDTRHRALTHNSWFIGTVLPRIFGSTITNSSGQEISVVALAEHHILEDYDNAFIPAASDFLEQIEFQLWMDNGRNGARPPSHAKLGKFHMILKSEKPKRKSKLKRGVLAQFIQDETARPRRDRSDRLPGALD